MTRVVGRERRDEALQAVGHLALYAESCLEEKDCDLIHAEKLVLLTYKIDCYMCLW